MPRYDYICQTEEKIFEVVQSFRDETLTVCPNCEGAVTKYYGSVNFSPSSMPTRGGDAPGRNAHEKQLEKDLPAYKRLRMEGLQPKSTVGAAQLEAHASTKYEIESGTIVDKYIAKRADESKTFMSESGLI